MTIPIVLVVGPTASGKSTLALALAEALAGEVVSADAMAVYRQMDIGTAKPLPEERLRVPHHCLDVVEPEDRCDLARWLSLAETAVQDIHTRGRVVIVAGGSPLYVKALLEGLSAGAPRDEDIRRSLVARAQVEGDAALYAELVRLDPVYAGQIHAHDQRRIVRALEVFRVTGRPFSSFHVTDGIRRTDYRTLILGLAWDREVVNHRINQRTKAMFAAGLVEEVRRLRPRLSPEATQAVGYKEVIAHLDGHYDLDFAIYQVARNTRQLAKQQRTWLKRFRDIVWLPGDAPDLVGQALTRAQSFLAN